MQNDVGPNLSSWQDVLRGFQTAFDAGHVITTPWPETSNITNTASDWFPSTNEGRRPSQRAGATPNSSVFRWQDHPFWGKEPSDWKSMGSGPVMNEGELVGHVDMFMTHVLVPVILALGICGNILLFVLTFQPELRHLSYSVYLTAVSVLDTVFLALICVSLLLRSYNQYIYIMPVYRCRLIKAIFKLSAAISPWTLVAISIDRLIAMEYPMKKHVYCTPSRARLAMLVISLFCLAFFLPEILSLEEDVHVCTTNDEGFFIYSAVADILITALPNMVMLCLNVRTIVTIRAGMHNRQQIRAPVNAEGQRQSDVVAARRSTLSLLSMPVFCSVFMLPYSVTILYNTMYFLHMAQHFVPVRFYLYIRAFWTGFRSVNLWYSAQHFIPKTDIERRMMDVESHLHILYTITFASNMYLLLASSPNYRNITRRMLHLSTRQS